MRENNLLILIILLSLFYDCKGQDDKKVIKTIVNQDSSTCFVKQNLLQKNNDTEFKFDDYKFELINNEETYNLSINSKKYLTNLTLESSEINFWNYKCDTKNVILIEGDDYYGSTFFAYLMDNDNLYSLGEFVIEQLDVEKKGPQKKDFKIYLEGYNVKIVTYLNGKNNSTNIFNKRNRIALINNSTKNPKSITGEWKVNCEDARSLDIDSDKEIFLVVQGNQIAVNMIKLEKSTSDEFFYRLDKKPLNMGSGGNALPWETYLNNNEIAKIKVLNDNQIEFTWLGFYNDKTKEREVTDCEFTINSGENPVILTKCK